MLRYLLPPQISHERDAQSFAYSALHYTLILLMFLAGFVSIAGNTIVHNVVAPTVFVLFGVCFLLLHSNRPRFAGNLFIIGFWVLITVDVYILNGINNAGFFLYMLTIVYTNILFTQRRYVVIITLLSCLSGVILTFGHVQDFLPLMQSETPIIYDRLIIAFGLFGGSGFLLSSVANILHRNVERLKEQETQLQERNQELENLTEQLRASEERYRILFENSGVMTSVYDAQGNVLLANQYMLDKLGKDRQETKKITIYDIFGEKADETMAKQQEALEKNAPLLYESNVTLENGQYLDYLRHVIPLPVTSHSDSKSREVLVLTTDITERKVAERQKQELELAQEKLNFLSEFFSTISHDIKTPLTTMNTSLHLLERSTDDTQRQNRIDRIKRQVLAIESYIQDMLTMSRLEHIPTLSLTQVNIRSLIEETLDDQKPALEKKSIQLKLDYGGYSEPVIKADREQLRRMMTNLIENAINYSPINSTVSIKTMQINEKLQIELNDTGNGISPEALPHIFERFYRGAQAKSQVTTGSGLGLAIVKKIVDLHQGDIHITSEVNKGTNIYLQLPVDI